MYSAVIAGGTQRLVESYEMFRNWLLVCVENGHPVSSEVLHTVAEVHIQQPSLSEEFFHTVVPCSLAGVRNFHSSEAPL